MPERSLKARTCSLVLSVREVAYLDDLVELGLFGASRREVVHTLMRRGLQDAMRDRFLTRR